MRIRCVYFYLFFKMSSRKILFKCCVLNCNSVCYFNMKSQLSFYCIPKDYKMQNKWLMKSGRNDLITYQAWKQNSKKVRFCSLHFENSAFHTPIPASSRPKLKSSVIPTLNIPEGVVDDELTAASSVREPLQLEENLNSIPKNQFDFKRENCKLIYKNHLSQILESLANDESYMDVTLTAEGRAINAHKCILSVASPHFKEILKQNVYEHPIISMPANIKIKDLSYIVSYIYRGELTICAQELASLLKTAELLKISGLVSSDLSNSNNTLEDQKSTQTFNTKNTKDVFKPKTDSTFSSNSGQKYTEELPSPPSLNVFSIKQEIKEEPEESIIENCWSEVVDFKSEYPESESPSDSIQDESESPPFECPHCREVKRPLEVLESHLSSKHPTKPSFVCKNCARVFRRQRIFYMHLKACQPSCIL